MNFFLFHSPVKNLKDKTIKHMLAPIYEPPHNTNEESEFLEDPIRVKDQPLMYTEDRITAGCPEDMW